MSAGIAALALAASYIPQLISIGTNVAPLIVSLREALNNIGTDQVKSTEEFKALDATVAGFESDFQDAVAQHMASVNK